MQPRPSRIERVPPCRWRIQALALGVGAVLTGCGTPRWQVAELPPGGALVVDGVVTAPSAEDEDDRGDTALLDRTIPYYGRSDVALVPAPVPPSDNPQAPPLPHATIRAGVAIPEPVSPWLFPIDFFLEMAQLPFVRDDDVVTRVELQPARRVDAIPSGPDSSTAGQDLRERARAAVRDR